MTGSEWLVFAGTMAGCITVAFALDWAMCRVLGDPWDDEGGFA